MSVFATSPRAVGRRLGMSWLSEFWHRTTIKELDREALRNVEVERKVLREYRVSKSMPVPEFLHERFDKADSDSASV